VERKKPSVPLSKTDGSEVVLVNWSDGLVEPTKTRKHAGLWGIDFLRPNLYLSV